LSVITFLLALTVTGILKMLVAGLALTAGYAVVVLMTMYFPGACRRSTASWTLGAAMAVFVVWLVAKQFHSGLPDAIFFTLPVSIVVFFLVSVIDRRRIEI
jgi:SSS family solute:Na+ symporter